MLEYPRRSIERAAESQEVLCDKSYNCDMKTRAFILLIAMTAAPLLAWAQQPPAPPAGAPPAWHQGNHQAFKQFRQQSEHLRAQARAAMLAALTPGHRALLARIAGNLAISPNPDPRAAAQQLDAALTPSERQSVLAAQQSLMSQMRSLHRQMRAQFMSQLTPTQKAQMQARMAQFQGRHGHHHHTPDAGFLLLRASLPGPPDGMRGHFRG